MLQRGTLPADAPRPDSADVDRLVVPGADILARWLDLPDRNDVQARSAVTFLLQDEVIEAGDDLHIALGAAEPDGRRLAVVARAEVV
ncbi:MAG TPA: type II secretion system protein GspL, partial [Caulobacter sp.]|nr:type II secretion system protein GspL [Caulobacter sp.]